MAQEEVEALNSMGGFNDRYSYASEEEKSHFEKKESQLNVLEKLKKNLIERYGFHYLEKCELSNSAEGGRFLKVIFSGDKGELKSELERFELNHDMKRSSSYKDGKQKRKVEYHFRDLALNNFLEKHGTSSEQFWIEESGEITGRFKNLWVSFFKSSCPLEELKRKIENRYDITISLIKVDQNIFFEGYKGLTVLLYEDDRNTEAKINKFLNDFSDKMFSQPGKNKSSGSISVTCFFTAQNEKLQRFADGFEVSSDALLALNEKKIESKMGPSVKKMQNSKT